MKKIIFIFVSLVVGIITTAFCFDYEQKSPILTQGETISAVYGAKMHIKAFGEDGWSYKLTSTGSVTRHGWKSRDLNGVLKIEGSDTYVYGTYSMTRSGSNRYKISIRWNNGKEESGYIDYPYSDGRSCLHINSRVYDEIR